MYLIVVAWLYVVGMMAVAEASSPRGTWLGAFVTLALYGLLPLAIVVYLGGSPARRAARRAEEAAQRAAAMAAGAQPDAAASGRGGPPSSGAPDAGRVPPGDAVAPVREEA